MRGFFALVVLACSMAGCAMAPPSPLSADQIKSMRLTEIAVETAPGAEIVWGNAEHEFVTAHNAANPKRLTSAPIETASINHNAPTDTSEYNAIVASPEGQAFIRNKAANRVKEALETNLKPALQSGTRPVRLEIAIQTLFVPSAVQRVVVGGVPGMSAIAVLKDAKTGEKLVQKELATFAPAGNGLLGVLVDQAFSDLDVRVANSYADTYRNWLLNET